VADQQLLRPLWLLAASCQMSFDVGDIGCWLWVDMAPTLCHAVGPLGMCFEVDLESRIIDGLTYLLYKG